MELFIERLVEMRTELKLSQNELAKKIGVSPMCISRWEKGTRTPNAQSIILLCQVLKCSADYLLGISKA